jgi:hypothetical protein
MTWVWNHSQSKHSARLVLLAIADSMNSEHAWAWPSNTSLAQRTNMSGRAVQMAVGELVKLGELEVGLNEGPKGCNRYRVRMTPEKFSPQKSFHPEEAAPPKDFRGSESGQVNPEDPEDFSPPEESSPPKETTATPEKFSPGTVKEPKTKISPSERSTAQNSLFPGDETALAAAGGKRPRGRPTKTGNDPLFGEWYAAYPLHKSPGDAEKAWERAVRDGANPQVLIAAAKSYASQRRGEDPRYTKHPASWLNKKCWLDEEGPPPGPQARQEGSPRPPVGRRTNFDTEEYHSGW